jgi:hypothetical protein
MGEQHVRALRATPHPLMNVKNLIALVLVVGVVSVSIITRGPQVHGHICFFDDSTCQRADRVDRHATLSAAAEATHAEAEDTGAAAVCKMSDILKLMACKGGGFNDKCCKGYQHFFTHNCVCAYDAWPRQYVGDDMNAFNWVNNIMKCNMSYAEVASSSPCIQQTTTCAPPTQGDVMLLSHPRGASVRLPPSACAPSAAPRGCRGGEPPCPFAHAASSAAPARVAPGRRSALAPARERVGPGAWRRVYRRRR